MDQSTIKVIIADEHYLFREGIKALLSSVSEVRVVEEATTAAEAVRLAETHGADLLMLDAALSDPDLVKKMREIRPHTRVLLVSNSDQSTGIDLAAQAGATGWLARHWPAREILKAIRQSVPLTGNPVREGGGASGPGVSGSGAEGGEIALTRREHQILELLMLRRSSREIAETLALSVKTVESHKFNLMRKLDVHSRSELIKLAIRKQLVSPAASLETVEPQPA